MFSAKTLFYQKQSTFMVRNITYQLQEEAQQAMGKMNTPVM
jgi:hypothetical protein